MVKLEIVDSFLKQETKQKEA
ncbi:hypothetical protein C5167_015044 [Papaver somniferum]|uniref:Uncharacterized protein n=1 Tax=Papaver somniferum TaxID=3469 RepID=A0A4Y7J7Z1_PAPSO|nr:hypothetical protein C5167_015044 [Papaver somniferum]